MGSIFHKNDLFASKKTPNLVRFVYTSENTVLANFLSFFTKIFTIPCFAFQPKTHCAQVTTISDPPPSKKKRSFFWRGMFFWIFFMNFLRWGQKILHDHSRELSRPSGRILAGQMPFPATNLVLNFTFLQKFMQFAHF